jgi:hypothetical protein
MKDKAKHIRDRVQALDAEREPNHARTEDFNKLLARIKALPENQPRKTPAPSKVGKERAQ